MATPTLVPVELYLHSPAEYEPDAEYVDGEIELRPMGEYDHATWQQAIERWFLGHLKDWNIRVRVELRVRVSATRYRVPDVVVFDRGQPIEQILTRPPIAVFEVLSPEDRMSRMMVKLGDYEAMGIRTIRVVDPATQAIFRYENGRLENVVVVTEELADGPCSIDWEQVRTLLDA
jgi:Uma2 family endonuclease